MCFAHLRFFLWLDCSAFPVDPSNQKPDKHRKPPKGSKEKSPIKFLVGVATSPGNVEDQGSHIPEQNNQKYQKSIHTLLLFLELRLF